MEQRTATAVDEQRWTMSVSEAALRLGISRAHAYRMVAAGELPSLRLGRRTVVPVVALRRLLEGGGEICHRDGASVSVDFPGLPRC